MAIKQAEAEVYRKEMREATSKAMALATRAADVDIGVFRGRGPAFVLEFTAVVVIIFAALILGVLKLVDGKEIITLLAAIAGYVLGRSVSSAAQPTAPPATAAPAASRPPHQPAALTKIRAAGTKAEEEKPQGQPI